MKHNLLFPLLIVLLSAAYSHAGTRPYWVFFSDRGIIDVESIIAAKKASPSEPKNLGRRARLVNRDRLFDETDVPVNPDYIKVVAELAERLRTVSRYFNAVTVDLEDSRVEVVGELEFVAGIKPVGVFRKPRKPVPVTPVIREKPAALDYGNSLEQLSKVGVIPLHGHGKMGKDILVAVLDSGFENLEHAAFDSLKISNRWDFVDRNDEIGDDDHGSEVLSVMAALDHGTMIGAAPYATYLLARTEIVEGDDIREEEDYWIAGIEWADSLGADVVNSSLGYHEFDDFSYIYDDMDGRTARTTLAANIAAEKGIVVVTSAGNEGNKSWYYITSPADAFGVIAVGSVDRNGIISDFSSRGPSADGRVKPEFVSLGEQVWTVDTSTSDSYHFQSGTSFSAPSVSGAVTLLLEVNHDLTPAALIDSLKTYAKDAGPDSLYGYGLIDAYAASGLKTDGPDVSLFRVYDPYPQPFVFSDVDRYVYFPMDVPVDGKKVTIRIFNFSGENVKTIEETIEKSGSLLDRTEAPSWDATNFTNDDVSPGVYYYTVRLTGYGGHTGKIAVIR